MAISSESAIKPEASFLDEDKGGRPSVFVYGNVRDIVDESRREPLRQQRSCSDGNLDDSKLIEYVKKHEASDEETTGAIQKSLSHERKPSRWKKTFFTLTSRRGLLLAAFSAVSNSFKNVVMEIVVTDDLNPFQMLVMLMPPSVVGSLVWLIWKKIKVLEDYHHCLWLILSGILLSSFLSLFSLSIQIIDVGDTVTVTFTALIQVGILSWIILREPLRPLDFIFALLALTGVVFVARPPFIFGSDSRTGNTLLGVCFALGASFSIALLFVVYRKQSQLGINTFTSMLANSSIVIIVTAVFCTACKGWRSPNCREFALSELGGMFFFIGQVCGYFALKFESATNVMITETLEIVFTFLLQFLILGIVPVWVSYVGALLVMSACCGIAFRSEIPQDTGLDEYELQSNLN